MKKKQILLLTSCLLAIFSLIGCSEEESSLDGKAVEKLEPIEFDNVYVQNVYDYYEGWPIALESYSIEESIISIKGSFIIPNSYQFENIDKLETFFNSYNFRGSYVQSYNPYESSINSYLGVWKLNDINEDNYCFFNLNIDLTPLIENEKLLGDLLIYGRFRVVHNFKGEQI